VEFTILYFILYLPQNPVVVSLGIKLVIATKSVHFLGACLTEFNSNLVDVPLESNLAVIVDHQMAMVADYLRLWSLSLHFSQFFVILIVASAAYYQATQLFWSDELVCVDGTRTYAAFEAYVCG
jgi:hypothetical protein